MSTLFVALLAPGCKKKAPAAQPEPESVITNRANDRAYLDELKQSRRLQTAQAAERFAVAGQMTACVARVKAALPADAGEAALQAALERDEEWRSLAAQDEEISGRIRQTQDDARETVRKRMLEESRAAQAVAEGKARAADVSPSRP